jgi:hypothetical protein
LKRFAAKRTELHVFDDLVPVLPVDRDRPTCLIWPVHQVGRVNRDVLIPRRTAPGTHRHGLCLTVGHQEMKNGNWS